MKRISNLWLCIFLAVIALGFSGCTEVQANESTDFWVRGNCNMCKSRIESTLADAEGVAKAEYDLETNTAHVEYDSLLTDEKKLHRVVADVGYETKMKAADMGAYQLLPRCCLKKEDQ